MDAVATLTSTQNFSRDLAANVAPDESAPLAPRVNVGELMFELGMWLSGLESYLNFRNSAFVKINRNEKTAHDWTKEFSLTHSTLLRCSRLTLQLAQVFKKRASASDNLVPEAENSEISSEELFDLYFALKDAILISEGLLRAVPLNFKEWTAWSNSLTDKFKKVAAFDKMIRSAEKAGEQFLPDLLVELLQKRTLPIRVEADLKLILPRFGKVLKWLSVVEQMIKADKPLKPSLLIFARVYEQIQEIISYLNNRLLRYPNEQDALFSALDGAAYAASIELRKVFTQEITGLSEIRPSPLVRARIDASYGLLNDSFQLTLVGFAQLIDPSVEPETLFPSFKVKREQSITLRRELWQILQSVQQAEQNVEEYPMESLREHLTKFSQTTMQFLMFKDWETMERFIEEVLQTKNDQELVSILHRFGAYLETLFGQISMRSVLANYPFEYPPD